MSTLEITNLKKVFQRGTPSEHTGLDGVSLNLEKGEFVCIVGSNGAGKTTLFNAIAGNFTPDSGKIVLDGEDITYVKEHVRAKNIGRIFQDPKTGTSPNLTIEENLALVCSKAFGRFPLRAGLKASDRAYFKKLLASLDMGLEDRLNVPAGLLSGGQRQALTLLMATVSPPKLLLLDEHTAALDPITAERVTALTDEITQKDGITTLMITHNIGAALKKGTRTIMMDSGKIVLDVKGSQREGMTPSDLLEEYRKVMNRQLDNDRILFS